MESNTIFIVFLCLFLAGSGIYAIMKAIQRLGTDARAAADSSLDTRFFKWNAPAGFVYGVVAILLVMAIIRFWTYLPQTTEAQLSNPNGSVHLVLKSTVSSSALEGKVLITYDKKAFGPSSLKFQGISGVGTAQYGPFKDLTRLAERGDQFFIRLNDGPVWGVNVMEEQVDMTIELFPTQGR